MKLRNLLFGTMIACAFVSCSNDDDPIDNGGQGNTDGKTILTAQFDVPAATKAGDDAQINTLHMLVFSNGTLETIGSLKSGETTIAEATVNLADKKILMIANVELPATVAVGATENVVLTALSASKALTFSEESDALSMNSKLYTGVTVTPQTNNYLGWSEAPSGGVLVGGINDATNKVKMYRNAAKVVLTTIKTKEGYTEDLTRVPYKEPQLEVKKVYILQANQYSKIVPSDASEYGATELSDGYISGAFTDGMEFDDDDYVLQPSSEELSYIKSLEGTATISSFVDANLPFYVFENTNLEKDASTLLVVEGEFSYLNQKNERVYIMDGDKHATRYYPIAIGQTKAQFSAAANALLALRNISANTLGVYRNLQYNISLTAVGPGYERPTGGSDPTMLDVQVEVVAYGEVNQDVEI